MTHPAVRLVLAIHNHQPIGNFEGVMEDAFQDSYSPFLETLMDYPELKISLHTSGSLIEWLESSHPEYIDQIRELVQSGQIEMIGGPFYEPILACIPRRDRIGQIRAYTEHLNKLFKTEVRGMWMPERVWEQSFAGDIMAAGIEYSILDDYHFLCAGLDPDTLHGYFTTEDEGRLFKVFPGSERLRYTIPFEDPQHTIDHLRRIAERSPGTVVVFGDDGEKFGTWPGTKDHVYRDGWLRRFFETLRDNSDWLQVTTLAESVDHVAPSGTIYLPDSSYREMNEWALPTEPRALFEDLMHRESADPDWLALKRFARGGFWRNFRVKYPESNEMYARMLEISQRVLTLERSTDGDPVRMKLAAQARTELYRGQCNCPYWHGAFGGIYLPHLRNAIYRSLISADSLIEAANGRLQGRWVDASVEDYDLDARKEIRLASDRLIAYIAPARGGHLYELDIRGAGLNALATLDRRPEPYHAKVRAAAAQQDPHASGDGHVTSIHDLVHFKQPDLDKKLDYDNWPRKSLVDHFLQPGLAYDAFRLGRGSNGDFVDGVYQTMLRREAGRVEVQLTRDGHVGSDPVRVTKSVFLKADTSGTLGIVYELSRMKPGTPIHFAVEFNFAGIPGGASDRYFYDGEGRQLGPTDSILSLENAPRIGLTDEWLGLDISLDFSRRAGIWTMPIQTVSQSEGGFELVYQNCAVVPRWEFVAPGSGTWRVELTLAIDTSVAQARQLRETAASNA